MRRSKERALRLIYGIIVKGGEHRIAPSRVVGREAAIIIVAKYLAALVTSSRDVVDGPFEFDTDGS